MSRGASGLVGKKSSSGSISGIRQQRHSCGGSGTEPIIRRGTHARVKAIERAIDAFLSLPLSRSKVVAGNDNSKAVRQVVILGSGRDTTYLRYRFGKKESLCLDDDDTVRWYEVDHPSVIIQKAHSWLPGCIPSGYECNCTVNEDTGNSYAVTIAPSQKGGNRTDRSGQKSTSSNYHLIGHDLRAPPASLFETLTHPKHGYDRSIPTLFVLECVMMYLPDKATWELLRYLADSPTASSSQHNSPSSSDPFVAVAIYDPIPSNDRFGQLMIENLERAGIMGRKGHSRTRSGDDDDQAPQLSLEKTQTLSDQLTKLTQSGFNIAVGCDMMNAYDHGVISVEDRRRAARCEMLDELEEFVLLMKHYCLVVGVSSCKGRKSSKIDTTAGNESIGFQLCSVGKDSLMGFQEGRCMVTNR